MASMRSRQLGRLSLVHSCTRHCVEQNIIIVDMVFGTCSDSIAYK